MTITLIFINLPDLTIKSDTMKKIKMFFLFTFSFFLFLATCTEKVKEEKIPVTTSSEKAAELYSEALGAGFDVEIAKANELYTSAVEEDPDFLLPYYQMAIYDLYLGNMENFREHAEKAVAIEAELSPGEELLQEALGKWLEDPKADITETGNELVEMYPNDEQAYYFLAFCHYIAGNHKDQIETYKQALEIAEHKGAIYNSLGYAYMNLKNFEEAEKAFNTYIELEPDLPNPYDSKGDYYMAVEDYEKATEHFMKAYEIDTTWEVSYNKALKAKAMLDSLKTE